jgi:hypothetical protein
MGRGVNRGVWVIALLLLPATGCALLGFDPLPSDDDGMSGSSGTAGVGSGGRAGTNPSGGSGGITTGGMGGISGTSGNGGASGGSGGTISLPDAGPNDPDATMPVTECTGRDNLDRCDDGAFCTEDDFCYDGVCVPGDERRCGDGVCETNVCDEALDECRTTIASNNTTCLSIGVCVDGRCSSPVFNCEDGGECNPVCSGVCDVRCQNAMSCDIDCLAGSSCTTNCTGAKLCDFECADALSCFVNCEMTGTCTGSCSGGSTCHVVCTDFSGCEDIACLDGARCKLECLEEESCGFAECWDGEQLDCGDGTVTCGGLECADG